MHKITFLVITFLVLCPAAKAQDITPLPIGKKPENAKQVATYGQALAGFSGNDSTYYDLPPIKNAQYVVADTATNLGLCYSTLADMQIKLKHYKYRLPDYKGLQVFYMTGDGETSTELKEEFGVDCYARYGNLITYNPITQTAKILTINFDFYIDSQQSRYFYIDKEYTIYMAEESFSEGEEGAEQFPGNVYMATINYDGSFTIKKIFEPK